MAVLVTGGAGFIGSHLVERLVREGESVVCLDNFDPFYDPALKRDNLSAVMGSSYFRLIIGDIRDAACWDEALGRGDVTAIVHLAALAGVRPSVQRAAEYTSVNVDGTVRMLEAAVAAQVPKVIFGSSSTVYGAGLQGAFSEDQARNLPLSPYGASKAAGEAFCHVYHHLHGLNVVCLRFFSVYGPRVRPDLAMHIFARHISQGTPLPLYGDGTAERDFTYIADIVSGIIEAMRRPLTFETINLGHCRPIAIRRLIDLLAKALGKQPVIDQQPARPEDAPMTCANIDRARQLLGYEPRVEFEEGLAHFAQWFKRVHGGG